MGKCAGCGKIIRSKKGVSGPPVETGPNLEAYLAMIKQYGMTYGNLNKLCTDLLDIPLTRSGILGIVNRNVDKMNPIYDIIGNHVPKELSLHGDESGWKVRGKSGYIWIFCNKNVVYFLHDKSRAGTVPKDVVGGDYKGIFVCDFYGGYNFLENTQRCLVHFLRDIKKQCEIYTGRAFTCLD
jgi:transposase